jgi:hypothetical protein
MSHCRLSFAHFVNSTGTFIAKLLCISQAIEVSGLGDVKGDSPLSKSEEGHSVSGPREP